MYVITVAHESSDQNTQIFYKNSYLIRIIMIDLLLWLAEYSQLEKDRTNQAPVTLSLEKTVQV